MAQRLRAPAAMAEVSSSIPMYCCADDITRYKYRGKKEKKYFVIIYNIDISVLEFVSSLLTFI